MATKNFAQMSTKKLNALLETASPEEQAAINEVLSTRAQVAKATAEQASSEEAPLTAEEQAAIDAAEANGGINPNFTGRTVEKKAKITDLERDELVESLKVNINHRCQIVPFNTVDWVDGVIVGVVADKRTNKVLYTIKTDDGRRVVKVHDSKLIKILDEMIEPVKTVRSRKTREAVEKTEWTPEMIATEINEVIGNVGKTVEFEKYSTKDENGEIRKEMNVGRIMAIVPDKRAQRLLYRIEVAAPIEGNSNAVKTMHKVVNHADLEIAQELDEVGAELNAKYIARRNASSTRSPLTPQDRYIKCEENLKKAEEKLAKITEEIELRKKQLEEAKAEIAATLDEQSAETTDTDDELA